MTGEFYNVSEDGSARECALDKGARCYYKVQVKDASGQLLAESAALQVSYYNQLEMVISRHRLPQRIPVISRSIPMGPRG